MIIFFDLKYFHSSSTTAETTATASSSFQSTTTSSTVAVVAKQSDVVHKPSTSTVPNQKYNSIVEYFI